MAPCGRRQWMPLAAACLLSLLVPLAYAADASQWVPGRYQGGPLDGGQEFPDLKLLEGTPVNCLLLTWAGGKDRAIEQQQQRLATGIVKRARARGIAVLGVIRAGADPAVAVPAAREAALDGIVYEKDATRFSGKTPLPIFEVAEGTVPQVRVLSGEGATEATPSGEPWLDSNLWQVRMLRARNNAPAWISFVPEQKSPAEFARAIAEAAAAGGHWVLPLGTTPMPPSIAAYLAFFEKNRAWQQYAPAGPLAIIDDSASPSHEMYDEYLNLMMRRRIPYRIVERRALTPAALAGCKAVLAIELTAPQPEERSILTAFASGGGLLVGGPAWGKSGPAGKGRIVTYPDESPDPELVAHDMLNLLGVNNLGVRLFNTASVLPQISTGPAGKHLLIQLVNYASTPAEDLTVRVFGSYRTIHLSSPDTDLGEPELDRSTPGRVDIRLHTVPVYAALELKE